MSAFVRIMEKDFARRDFRVRQLTLAGCAAVQLAGALFTGYAIFLAVAMLLIQAGSVEALRFRKSGRSYQTKRAIWRGSTPHDARCRHLLNGWHP